MNRFETIGRKEQLDRSISATVRSLTEPAQKEEVNIEEMPTANIVTRKYSMI